jgi:hypothetical protein
VFFLVAIYGVFPGIATGVVLGIVADALRIRPAFRIAILLLPAIAMVVLLGRAFYLEELILPACIPTAAGILILERSTRPRSPGEHLPVARSM